VKKMNGEFVARPTVSLCSRQSPARLKQVSPGQTTKKWLAIYSERTNVVERPPVGYEAAGE
jgi:hypothetical protein